MNPIGLLHHPRMDRQRTRADAAAATPASDDIIIPGVSASFVHRVLHADSTAARAEAARGDMSGSGRTREAPQRAPQRPTVPRLNMQRATAWGSDATDASDSSTAARPTTTATASSARAFLQSSLRPSAGTSYKPVPAHIEEIHSASLGAQRAFQRHATGAGLAAPLVPSDQRMRSQPLSADDRALHAMAAHTPPPRQASKVNKAAGHVRPLVELRVPGTTGGANPHGAVPEAFRKLAIRQRAHREFGERGPDHPSGALAASAAAESKVAASHEVPHHEDVDDRASPEHPLDALIMGIDQGDELMASEADIARRSKAAPAASAAGEGMLTSVSASDAGVPPALSTWDPARTTPSERIGSFFALASGVLSTARFARLRSAEACGATPHGADPDVLRTRVPFKDGRFALHRAHPRITEILAAVKPNLEIVGPRNASPGVTSADAAASDARASSPTSRGGAPPKPPPRHAGLPGRDAPGRHGTTKAAAPAKAALVDASTDPAPEVTAALRWRFAAWLPANEFAWPDPPADAAITDPEFVRVDSSGLPLEAFDDDSFERRTPVEWLQSKPRLGVHDDTGSKAHESTLLEGPLAFSPVWSSIVGEFRYCACIVLAYCVGDTRMTSSEALREGLAEDSGRDSTPTVPAHEIPDSESIGRFHIRFLTTSQIPEPLRGTVVTVDSISEAAKLASVPQAEVLGEEARGVRRPAHGSTAPIAADELLRQSETSIMLSAAATAAANGRISATLEDAVIKGVIMTLPDPSDASAAMPSHGPREKHVPRLSLRFAGEDPYVHELRRAASAAMREEVRSAVRYERYLRAKANLSPLSDDPVLAATSTSSSTTNGSAMTPATQAWSVAPLAVEWQRRILRRAVPISDPRPVLRDKASFIRGLLVQARDAYHLSLLRAIADYNLRHPESRSRHLALRLPVPAFPRVALAHAMVTVSSSGKRFLFDDIARELTEALSLAVDPAWVPMHWLASFFDARLAQRRFVDTRVPLEFRRDKSSDEDRRIVQERHRRRLRIQLTGVTTAAVGATSNSSSNSGPRSPRSVTIAPAAIADSRPHSASTTSSVISATRAPASTRGASQGTSALGRGSSVPGASRVISRASSHLVNPPPADTHGLSILRRVGHLALVGSISESEADLAASVSYPMSIERWGEVQGIACVELLEDLEHDWRSRFVSELHDALHDSHNLYVREGSEYERSPLRLILRRAQLLMAEQLAAVASASIDDLVRFVASSSCSLRIAKQALALFPGATLGLASLAAGEDSASGAALRASGPWASRSFTAQAHLLQLAFAAELISSTYFRKHHRAALQHTWSSSTQRRKVLQDGAQPDDEDRDLRDGRAITMPAPPNSGEGVLWRAHSFAITVPAALLSNMVLSPVNAMQAQSSQPLHPTSSAAAQATPAGIGSRSVTPGHAASRAAAPATAIVSGLRRGATALVSTATAALPAGPVTNTETACTRLVSAADAEGGHDSSSAWVVGPFPSMQGIYSFAGAQVDAGATETAHRPALFLVRLQPSALHAVPAAQLGSTLLALAADLGGVAGAGLLAVPIPRSTTDNLGASSTAAAQIESGVCVALDSAGVIRQRWRRLDNISEQLATCGGVGVASRSRGPRPRRSIVLAVECLGN